MDKMHMKSGEFFAALPAATHERLPKHLRNFRVNKRSWLVQLYYVQPLLHYEVWNLGARKSKLEIGLHFESRKREENTHLLHGFQSHLFEIKAELGESFEAEPWDKGWSKVYETIEREPFSTEYLEVVAERLSQVIVVMQPIFELVHQLRVARSRKRK